MDEQSLFSSNKSEQLRVLEERLATLEQAVEDREETGDDAPTTVFHVADKRQTIIHWVTFPIDDPDGEEYLEDCDEIKTKADDEEVSQSTIVEKAFDHAMHTQFDREVNHTDYMVMGCSPCSWRCVVGKVDRHDDSGIGFQEPAPSDDHAHSIEYVAGTGTRGEGKVKHELVVWSLQNTPSGTGGECIIPSTDIIVTDDSPVAMDMSSLTVSQTPGSPVTLNSFDLATTNTFFSAMDIVSTSLYVSLYTSPTPASFGVTDVSLKSSSEVQTGPFDFISSTVTPSPTENYDFVDDLNCDTVGDPSYVSICCLKDGSIYETGVTDTPQGNILTGITSMVSTPGTVTPTGTTIDAVTGITKLILDAQAVETGALFKVVSELTSITSAVGTSYTDKGTFDMVYDKDPVTGDPVTFTGFSVVEQCNDGYGYSKCLAITPNSKSITLTPKTVTRVKRKVKFKEQAGTIELAYKTKELRVDKYPTKASLDYAYKTMAEANKASTVTLTATLKPLNLKAYSLKLKLNSAREKLKLTQKQLNWNEYPDTKKTDYTFAYTGNSMTIWKTPRIWSFKSRDVTLLYKQLNLLQTYKTSTLTPKQSTFTFSNAKNTTLTPKTATLTGTVITGNRTDKTVEINQRDAHIALEAGECEPIAFACSLGSITTETINLFSYVQTGEDSLNEIIESTAVTQTTGIPPNNVQVESLLHTQTSPTLDETEIGMSYVNANTGTTSIFSMDTIRVAIDPLTGTYPDSKSSHLSLGNYNTPYCDITKVSLGPLPDEEIEITQAIPSSVLTLGTQTTAGLPAVTGPSSQKFNITGPFTATTTPEDGPDLKVLWEGDITTEAPLSGGNSLTTISLGNEISETGVDTPEFEITNSGLTGTAYVPLLNACPYNGIIDYTDGVYGTPTLSCEATCYIETLAVEYVEDAVIEVSTGDWVKYTAGNVDLYYKVGRAGLSGLGITPGNSHPGDGAANHSGLDFSIGHELGAACNEEEGVADSKYVSTRLKFKAELNRHYLNIECGVINTSGVQDNGQTEISATGPEMEPMYKMETEICEYVGGVYEKKTVCLLTCTKPDDDDEKPYGYILKCD
jgi:hypothetical protein